MTKHREAGKGGNRMKVGVTQEEKYPVYEIDLDNHTPEAMRLEVPDDLIQRYTEVMKLFKEVQAELAAIFLKPYK